MSKIAPSPTNETINFPLLERISRRALRRHALSERERLIAEIVLDFSYAIGRPAALIPRQDIFVTLTGITKGNVSTVLLSLESARILNIIRAESIYTFLPDSSTWRVRSRLTSEAHVAAADRTEVWLVETARIQPEQLHLLPPLPDLDLLLAEDARKALSSSETFNAHSEPLVADAISHGYSAVPRGSDLTARIADSLGLAVPLQPLNQSDPDIYPVPESGTSSRYGGNSHLNALNESYSSPLNAIQCAVPDSGTMRRSENLEAELLAEITEVVGKPAMEKYGGFWRKLIRQDAIAVRDALSDLKLRRQDPRRKAVKCAGAWLRSRYQLIRKS